jgi:hypothetical protein
MNTDSENSYIFFTQALDYVQRKCCHENTRPAEQTSAVVIFSWAPSSSSINHHSALISDTIINKKKNNNNSAYPNTERPVGHTVSLSRRSVCGNVCTYFQFSFLLRVALLLLLLVPVLVVLLEVGAVELGRSMVITGATEEILVKIAITVAGR